MKRLSILLILIAFCFSAYCQSTNEIAVKTLNATVSVFMQDNANQIKSMGSGAIVSENLIVTNYHVIEGGYKGYVLLNNDQTKYKIEGFVSSDTKNDLALLKVTGVPSKEIQFCEASSNIGDNIYVAGNPQGLTGTFSDGIVSALRILEDKELIQITAPISPGSSGGPVVNSKGELIGIAVGAYTNGQNLNFAIPVKYVQDLVASQTILKPINTLYKSSTPSLTKSSVSIQGIELKNIVWGNDDYAGSTSISGYEQLQEFVIKNNTEYSVGWVRLLLLVYDKTKTLVDFADAIFKVDLQYDDITIPPTMAKTYNATRSVETKYGKYDDLHLEKNWDITMSYAF